MMLKKITLLLTIGVLLTISACEKTDPTSGGDLDDPVSLRITSIKVIGVNELNPQGEEWDEDGSAPDLFLKISINRELSVVITDTLTDFQSGDTSEFVLREVIEMSREDDFFTLELEDNDHDPSIPDALQNDDHLVRFDSSPWGPPYQLSNRDVITLTKPGGSLEITLDRTF